jgi:pimeloyl-ACP methyl ester carboxylesterase
MLIRGCGGRGCLRGATDYMAAKIPNGHIVVPQAGHASNLDQSEMFNQFVVTFLESSN